MARNEQQELHFNTAVELNDIAISLIEQGCYRPAMETLRDAALIMKNRCCLQQTQHGISEVNTTLPLQVEPDLGFLQSKLQNAARRLWISQQTLETNRKKNRICVHVISEDERPSTVARFCANNRVANGYDGGGGLDQAFILIRLCHLDDMNEILNTTSEVASKTTVIMYNYGIATRCLATSMTTTHFQRQKLEVRAYSTLKIIFANTMNGQDGICLDVKFNRALVVMFLMLHHLIDLSHKLGNDFHLQQYLMCLHKLQHWISVLCEMQSSTQGHAPAA